MEEYTLFAKYYDDFYLDKYHGEDISFLINIIASRKSVLDVGCGTGNHMAFLKRNFYNVEGLDKYQEMIDIAKEKVNTIFYCKDILNFKLSKKYDAIISMRSVFNHLKNYDEFEIALNNLLKHINDNGVIVIDLYNGRKNGSKEEESPHCEKIFEYSFDYKTFIEKSDITYIINNEKYIVHHEFLIYEIDKLKSILDKYNLKYKFYENYTFNEASDYSKNIQIVINM